VAAVLEQAGVTVEVLDLCGRQDVDALVRERTAQGGITHYGITATSPQMPAAMTIRLAIRETSDARIILGGPHATMTQAAARRSRSPRAMAMIRELTDVFDVVVAGDGEHAIFEALKPDAPALLDGDDPKSSLFLTSRMLDALPWPARHLVDADSYHHAIDGKRMHSIVAQLGCPFGCGFCGGRTSPSFRTVRMRSAESIVKEMEEMWRTYGNEGFMFMDDELNVNPKMLSLMALIRDRQRELGVAWRCRGFIKAELFTAAQADAMYEAGFRQVLIGCESADDRVLRSIQKHVTRADITRAVALATQHGLRPKALMSLGHPGETEDTITATRDWLLEVAPADFDATIITVYPGTPYFDEAVETAPDCWTYTSKKTGDRLHSRHLDYLTVAEYYKGIPNQYQSYVWTDALTSADLVRLRDDLEAQVRAALLIPYPKPWAAWTEQSMGQSNVARVASA
jgi:radical SAM superfamily enzyme YgiQ (UPF0313 family)